GGSAPWSAATSLTTRPSASTSSGFSAAPVTRIAAAPRPSLSEFGGRLPRQGIGLYYTPTASRTNRSKGGGASSSRESIRERFSPSGSPTLLIAGYRMHFRQQRRCSTWPPHSAGSGGAAGAASGP